jgi:hypothetical protein
MSTTAADLSDPTGEVVATATATARIVTHAR